MPTATAVIVAADGSTVTITGGFVVNPPTSPNAVFGDVFTDEF